MRLMQSLNDNKFYQHKILGLISAISCMESKKSLNYQGCILF
jgi:hypothetical protein